jgi:hypothetical protein
MQNLQMELQELEDRRNAAILAQQDCVTDEMESEPAELPSAAAQWEDINEWDDLAGATPSASASFNEQSPAFDNDIFEENPTPSVLPPQQANKRRLTPNRRTEQLYDRWRDLLPSLVGPYLTYHESSYQEKGPAPPTTTSIVGCTNVECTEKHSKSRVLCFYSHREFGPLSMEFSLSDILFKLSGDGSGMVLYI